MFFTLLPAKIHARHLILGNEKEFPEICLLRVYEHVRQLNAKKKYENNPLKKYQTTLRKICILRVFEHLTYKNAKTNGNTNNITINKYFDC